MMYNNYMEKVNTRYQTKLLKRLDSLQRDLKDEKITQEEFNILLGMLLKVEMNSFVANKIKHLDLEDDEKKMTFISYASTRNFNAA